MGILWCLRQRKLRRLKAVPVSKEPLVNKRRCWRTDEQRRRQGRLSKRTRTHTHTHTHCGSKMVWESPWKYAKQRTEHKGRDVQISFVPLFGNNQLSNNNNNNNKQRKCETSDWNLVTYIHMCVYCCYLSAYTYICQKYVTIFFKTKLLNQQQLQQ